MCGIFQPNNFITLSLLVEVNCTDLLVIFTVMHKLNSFELLLQFNSWFRSSGVNCALPNRNTVCQIKFGR